LQELASNHLKRLWSNARVVSVKEKAQQRLCQVRFKETSASEPLMRCRKYMDDVKTWGYLYPRISSWGSPGVPHELGVPQHPPEPGSVIIWKDKKDAIPGG
jgi:hypothetical protein